MFELLAVALAASVAISAIAFVIDRARNVRDNRAARAWMTAYASYRDAGMSDERANALAIHTRAQRR